MISFDKSIYSKAAIFQACDDYKELAKIKTIEGDNHVICEIVCQQNVAELIRNEFCNYVLNLTVMMGGAKR